MKALLVFVSTAEKINLACRFKHRYAKMRPLVCAVLVIGTTFAARTQTGLALADYSTGVVLRETPPAARLWKANPGILSQTRPAPAPIPDADGKKTLKLEPVHFKGAYARRVLAGCGLMFVSGCANGLNETISFHYNAFEKRLPNANDQFWDSRVSWRNKYREGDPESGPRFRGSTGVFVWTTDGYHLTNTLRTFFFVGGSFTIGAGKQRPTWQRVAEAGAGLLCYWAGNFFVYDMLFTP